MGGNDFVAQADKHIWDGNFPFFVSDLAPSGRSGRRQLIVGSSAIVVVVVVVADRPPRYSIIPLGITIALGLEFDSSIMYSLVNPEPYRETTHDFRAEEVSDQRF